MPNSVNVAGSDQNLDASLNTIISEFKLLEQERGTVKNTATHYPLKPHTGSSKIVLNYGQFTAYSVAEGVDIAQQQALSDTQTSYTPAEVAVQCIISDKTVRRVADPNLMGQIGRMMSNAYELKEDSDGCAQFSSFTATLGSTTTVATVGHVGAAAAKLRVGSSTTTPEPAPKPWFGVLHPYTKAVLEGHLIPLFVAPGTTAASSAGVLGGSTLGASNEHGMAVLAGKGAARLFDFVLVGDANVAIDSTPDTTNAFYSKEGLIFVEEEAPNDERERDASLRAWELNMVGSYVWGVYRPAAFGIAATFDGTTPTS